MPGIFISYRRSDSAHTVGRIFDHLALHFDTTGIFRDVDSIRPGQSFPLTLMRAIEQSAVGIVVMGPDWLRAPDPLGRRRIDLNDDFVRLEIEALLSRGIPVIPCLVQQGAMPSPEDLPESIRALAALHAAPVRPDPDFRHDMDRLVANLRAAAPSLDRVTAPRSRIGRGKGSGSRRARGLGWILGTSFMAISLWIGLEIGAERDQGLFYTFAVGLPLLILGVQIAYALRNRNPTTYRDE